MMQSLTCGCKIYYSDSYQGNTGVTNTYTEYCEGHKPPRPDQGADLNINVQITLQESNKV